MDQKKYIRTVVIRKSLNRNRNKKWNRNRKNSKNNRPNKKKGNTQTLIICQLKVIVMWKSTMKKFKIKIVIRNDLFH